MTVIEADLAEKYRRNGSDEWQARGSAKEHRRYMVPVGSHERRRCHCCKKRASHRGMANGIGLMSGCEWRVAQWIRNPQ